MRLYRCVFLCLAGAIRVEGTPLTGVVMEGESQYTFDDSASQKLMNFSNYGLADGENADDPDNNDADPDVEANVDSANVDTNELRRLLYIKETQYVPSWAIPVEEIWKMLPRAPADYPEALQGILWMDQPGNYGWSDPRIGGAAESLLSFGETDFSRWDPDTKTLYHSFACGGAWVTDDSPEGDSFRGGCSTLPGTITTCMRFRFSDDMDHCEIDFVWGFPPFFFPTPYGASEMTRNYPPDGACPPTFDATKEERNLCAKWIRQTYSFDDVNKTDPIIYPVFEIVGPNGRPNQPYFREFTTAMNSGKNVTHARIGVRVGKEYNTAVAVEKSP